MYIVITVGFTVEQRARSLHYSKKSKKGIDKLEKVCYNINVIRKGKTGTSQNKSKKGHDQREKVGKL